MTGATVDAVMIAMLAVPILIKVLAAVVLGCAARDARQHRRPGGRRRSLTVAR